MMKDILKLGLALTLFAIGACVALAVVFKITEPTIKGLEAKQLIESQKDLFPDADKFEDISASISSADGSVQITGAWRALRGDVLMGVVVKTLGKSYGGDAALLVGVGTDRRVAGIRILLLTDTPGLGANATSPTYFVDKSSKTTFPGQFAGKSINDPFEVKNDIIAISASTITSVALTKIAKAAIVPASAWIEANAAGGSK